MFKKLAFDAYIIFGEGKIEDMSSQLQSRAAGQCEVPEMTKAEEEEDEDEMGLEWRGH
uniref:Uncharacterized protein n=1 Tax=Physcomitrium patens TaxID=3218 RepID=A0A2K1K801_PHYPA|nr:hypothetical protein PHYPA_011798 [Physcomitrium patens]